MCPAIYDFMINTIAVVCCAIAIKLTDDWLDREQDHLACRKNWSSILGTGTMVYAMLFLIIAAAINGTVSLPLFLASYVVGMFHDLTNRFPLGLSGWQESLIILGLSIILFGWNQTAFALLVVAAVQLCDDCYDLTSDCMAGQRNFAAQFGCVECLLAALLSFLGAWWLNRFLFETVSIGIIIGYLATSRKGLAKHHG